MKKKIMRKEKLLGINDTTLPLKNKLINRQFTRGFGGTCYLFADKDNNNSANKSKPFYYFSIQRLYRTNNNYKSFRLDPSINISTLINRYEYDLEGLRVFREAKAYEVKKTYLSTRVIVDNMGDPIDEDFNEMHSEISRMFFYYYTKIIHDRINIVYKAINNRRNLTPTSDQEIKILD